MPNVNNFETMYFIFFTFFLARHVSRMSSSSTLYLYHVAIYRLKDDTKNKVYVCEEKIVEKKKRGA